ncbi:MAG: response regulator [Candidatus Pacebacteria bacterium]|nr:response regulator [Candidatus Paceibacterota bacterium]
MAESAHILIIDDDDRLSVLLKRYLESQDFFVTTAKNAAEAREILEFVEFDLLVVDVMMPGETGLEFARSWRSHSTVPMLLLTALGEVSDRITGLETGVDDYMAKPYEPRELVLRIQSILRRSQTVTQPETLPLEPDKKIKFGNFYYDRDQKILYFGDSLVRLTTAESALLDWLVEHLGQPQSREVLRAVIEAGGTEEVTPTDDADPPTRTVDVHITRLRRKLERDPKFPRYLQTVWGKGYVLKSD